MGYCKICGQENCKKHSFLIPKKLDIKQFSGSSPPEIFVGKYNYPNVNVGILSPQEYGDTQILSSPEEWHKQNLDIKKIVSLRDQLIYGRTQANIKKLNDKFLPIMQEVALTHKSVSTEFKLKKPISGNKEKDTKAPLITNAAPIERVRLEENATVLRKIDYITSDTDAKSIDSILELNNAGATSSHIMKILSAGLLGLKNNRKLVPTRWSITAVDDTLGKRKLEKIKQFPEISQIMIFTGEYLGNHYEFLLLPAMWSFEVIERSLNGGTWKDYESFFPRRKYAFSVTGAYYANRLALCEFLEKIKRQCSCLVFREIRPEYNTPLGVGILREASRAAFKNPPISCDTLTEALQNIQQRLKQPIENYTSDSELLENYGKQTSLSKWI